MIPFNDLWLADCSVACAGGRTSLRRPSLPHHLRGAVSTQLPLKSRLSHRLPNAQKLLLSWSELKDCSVFLRRDSPECSEFLLRGGGGALASLLAGPRCTRRDIADQKNKGRVRKRDSTKMLK